jgi:hypothetical protein
MKTRHLPRRCWKKLWKHCLKQSASGTIPVNVLSSNRDGYYLLRTEHRKRIGRAIPTLTYHEPDRRPWISWEYVY